jgi:hypothetical protein
VIDREFAANHFAGSSFGGSLSGVFFAQALRGLDFVF